MELPGVAALLAATQKTAALVESMASLGSASLDIASFPLAEHSSFLSPAMMNFLQTAEEWAQSSPSDMRRRRWAYHALRAKQTALTWRQRDAIIRALLAWRVEVTRPLIGSFGLCRPLAWCSPLNPRPPTLVALAAPSLFDGGAWALAA
jgi:hypothetical protein